MNATTEEQNPNVFDQDAFSDDSRLTLFDLYELGVIDITVEETFDGEHDVAAISLDYDEATRLGKRLIEIAMARGGDA